MLKKNFLFILLLSMTHRSCAMDFERNQCIAVSALVSVGAIGYFTYSSILKIQGVKGLFFQIKDLLFGWKSESTNFSDDNSRAIVVYYENPVMKSLMTMCDRIMALCELEDHQKAVQEIQHFIDSGGSIQLSWSCNHLGDTRQNTPLHKACENGNLSLITLFLDNGVDIRLKDREGWTALHYACRDGNVKVMKLLLEKGASLHDHSVERTCRLGRYIFLDDHRAWTPNNVLFSQNRCLLTKELCSNPIDTNLFYALFSGNDKPKSNLTMYLPREITQKIQKIYFDIADDPIVCNRMRALRELSEGPEYTKKSSQV